MLPEPLLNWHLFLDINEMVSIFYSLFLIALFFFSAPVKSTFGANSYYVNPSGSDLNNGSLAAPFRTFHTAVSKLKFGDILYISGGTFNESLTIPASISGISGSPITIKNVAGETPVIDMRATVETGIFILGNYINISGLEIKNVNGICARFDGTNINISKMTVHHCRDHGVQIQGKQIKFENSKIFLADLINQPQNHSSTWPSGLKIRAGEYITVTNNTIYNNYGEGIGIRGKHIVLKNNTVYDNFSVNIYVDNSSNVTLDSNFAFCTGNTEFYRSNHCAINLAAYEEYYSGWGSNLGQITIINNIAAFGHHNIALGWYDTRVSQPGVKGALVANNTLWGSSERGFIIFDAPANQNIRVYNNIVQESQGRLADFHSGRGITRDYNFWVGNPAILVNARGTHDKTGDISMLGNPVPFYPGTFMLSGRSTAIGSALFLNEVKFDFGNKSRGSAPDIGAFEYDPAPSFAGKSGDANGDNIVDGIDYVFWLQNYNKPATLDPKAGDFDSNGFVDGLDYVIWLNNYNK